MDPLQRIAATARESPQSSDSASGEHSARRVAAHSALSSGERTEARVLAQVSDDAYIVRVHSAAALVRSSTPLPVGEVVRLDVTTSGRPALLVASTLATPGAPAFAELVDGSTTARVRPLSADVAALLGVGGLVSADRLRTLGSGHHIAVEGARLAVDVTGPLPRHGQLVVQRAAQPADVVLVAVAALRSGPPIWFEPLVRELGRVGERTPGVGEVLARLAHALRALDAHGPRTNALRERLARDFTLPANGAELRQRLVEGGARYEARLAASVRAGLEGAATVKRSTAATDLRALLAAALDEGAQSGARESVVRALDTLGANALLAAAREQIGEPAWFPLPVTDGDGATTAWVRWRRDARGEAAGDSVVRAVLAVEFSQLGPVRVDAVLGARRLLVRVAVARPDVLEQVRAAGESLTSAFAAAGRSVVFGAALDDAESLRIHPERLPDPGPRGWIDTLG